MEPNVKLKDPKTYAGLTPSFPKILPPLEYADPIPGAAGGRVVIVAGTNRAGRHGRGCAKDAREFYGAVQGKGNGRIGFAAYGIPTKDEELNVLKPWQIQYGVAEFIGYATQAAEMNLYTWFLVTRIGCGEAGYGDSDIAPMFCKSPPNCILPEAWKPYLLDLNGVEWVNSRHWHCREGNGR